MLFSRNINKNFREIVVKLPILQNLLDIVFFCLCLVVKI